MCLGGAYDVVFISLVCQQAISSLENDYVVRPMPLCVPYNLTEIRTSSLGLCNKMRLLSTFSLKHDASLLGSLL